MRNFYNLKFRRQHPISTYIVDFYCHEKKLVFEVDGGVHNVKEEKEYDRIRESDLTDLGLKVIRFSNEDVIKNIDVVMEKLAKNCI